MDDWEREYEEDRRRLAMGKEIEAAGHRGADFVDPFTESTPLTPPVLTKMYAPMQPMGTLSPQMFAGDKSPPSTFADTAIPRGGADSQKNFSNNSSAADHAVHSREAGGNGAGSEHPYASKSDEEDVAAYYARYDTDADRPHAALAADTSPATGDALYDHRFALRALPAGWNLSSLFGRKMGKHLFFAEAIKTTFKGFLSSKETLVGCFVTPNCVYLGDVESGALVVCVDMQRLFEVYVFAGMAVGIRTRDALELRLQTQQHTKRFVDIVQKITSHWGADVRVVDADAERERRFMKEMRLIEKSSFNWPLVEDPRTGLRVVSITEQYVSVLAPVAPKILHWFGGLYQPGVDWKGSKTRHRRCAWVTATCLFVAKAEGPGGDGRGITHCVATEYMTELFTGPGGELGIIAGEGPKQPPLTIIFNTAEERDAVVLILQECYSYRKQPQGGTIRTTRVESVETKLRTEKGSNTRAQLFLMRPRKELYDFLRASVKKK